MAYRILILSSLLGFFSGCSSVTANDFFVSLNLRSEEISEDSNSQTETLEIENTRGTYSWTYEGYQPSEDFDTEASTDFHLTTEEIEALMQFIRNQELNQDLVEEQPMTDMGRSVEMALKVEMNGKQTEILIKGMSETWGEGPGATNLENFAVVEAAQDLIYTLKDLKNLTEE